MVHEVDGRTLTAEEHIAEVAPADAEHQFSRAIINGSYGRDDSDEFNRVYIDPADPELVYPSVTRVLGDTHALQKILTPWAARSASSFSVENIEELKRRIIDDGPEEAAKWVVLEAERIRDLKREIGTHQHNILEALLLDAPIPTLPDHLVDVEIDGERVDQDVMSDGLLNFLTDFAPTIEMAEAEVANTLHGYAGTLDLAGWFPTIRIPGRARKGARLVVDLKTGKTMGETAKPQIVSYKNATEVWVDNLGNKVDMPETDMSAVLHLRKKYKGGYKLYVVEPEHEQFYMNQFLAALETYKHQQEAATKPMRVFYPPLGDGSQPLPMIEDLQGDGIGRSRKPLISAGVENLGDLLKFTADEVASIKGIGPKSIEACRAVLARYDLAFMKEDV